MPKTIVITGASDGIGAAAARLLHAHGHTIAIVGRSPEKTMSVGTELDCDYFVADFSRFSDVRHLASTLLSNYPRIDVLANNAGGVFGDRKLTVDGFEKTLQINHLSPFLLTNLLLPALISSGGSVIQTTSVGARLFGHLDLQDMNNDRKFSPRKAYGDAKLMNILFTQELHARFHTRGLSTAAFHPGAIATNFASETTGDMRLVYHTAVGRLFLRAPNKGAEQLVWLASTRAGPDWRSGVYYERKRPASRPPRQAGDRELARLLWERSAAMTNTGPSGF
ncbi:SDR family NAD(P)-dependent oxidoreductase [Actinoplanes sp. NPDC051343]|uniref:SDR family NAD(P)-dependent oxidoreductase n=1 Tax=Actinoplanes sp. NPDC051343 TaxID=3363906 RepID=UPI003795E695